MNCKHCGTENPEEAVFCKHCGKRLDGEIFCTSCGKQLDGDSAFCIYCGQRIGEVQAKPAVSAVKSAPPVEQETAKTATVKKALNYTAAGLVLALAVFSFIFVFFIGFTASVGAYNVVEKESVDLFYYFGAGYEDLAKALEELDFTNFAQVCMYLPVVFGTLISAGAIIAVAVTSITAIVISIRYLVGKSKYYGAGFAMASFMSFIVGTLLLLALSNGNVSIESMTVSYSLNAATTAGAVLCSVVAAGYVGCAIAARGKELANARTLARLILSLASVVLVIVILSVASLPAYGIKTDEFGYGDKLNVGLNTVFSVLAIICSSNSNYIRIDNSAAVLAFGIVSCIMLIVLAILAACLLVKNVSGAVEDGKIAGFVLSIVLSVFALLFLVFGIVTAEQLLVAAEYAGGTDIMGEASDKVNFTYAVPIAILVFSLISLGANIAYKCLGNTVKQ